MTANTMAEVLEELDKHRPDHREYEGGWWELACAGCDFAKGERLSHLDWAPYRVHRAEVFAAALSAAGFGLVADTKAEEWGVRWEAAGPFPEEVHAKPSKESAEKSIAGSAFPGVVVRRTVTEWEAAL